MLVHKANRGRFAWPACALLTLLTTAFMAGCGSGGNTGGSDLARVAAANETPHGTVTVWSWNIAAKSLIALAPEFERKTPGVHVDVDMTGANMQTRFMLSLAAGTGAPDVSQLQLTDTPHYIATGQLADLTPVAAKYLPMFPKSRWSACMKDGRIYAIPWDMGPCAIFYKRNIFARYGIDPAKIQTWDDYIAAGQEIVRKSGGRTKMLPLGSGDIEQMLEILMQQTGGQVFDAQGRIDVDSAGVRQALDIIRRIRQAGICSDSAAYGQEWMAGFTDDTVATYVSAVWLGGLIKDSSKDFTGSKPTWGVFHLPAAAPGGVRVANLGGSTLVIPASCANKAAAWAFIEYALCTTQGQLEQYRNFDLFPSFLPALKTPDMDKPDPFFDGQPAGRLFATDVDKIASLNITPDWAEGTTYLTQDLSHWASEGMSESDEAVLANVAQKLHRRLGDAIAPPEAQKTARQPARSGAKEQG